MTSPDSALASHLFSVPFGIYMDGNSLGLMPLAAEKAVLRRLQDWRAQAVSGWDSWFGLAESLSPALGPLPRRRVVLVLDSGSGALCRWGRTNSIRVQSRQQEVR